MATDPKILALSCPLEDEGALTAAKSLLGLADAGREIDRIYPRLLKHRTLLTAMAHLERAGADLEQLTVSSDLFKTSWPLNSLFPSPGEPSEERVSLASIRSRLETHRILLQKLTASVVDFGEESLLLFGRALEAAYPSYRHRMDYDVDLLASDIEMGLRLLTRLHEELHFLLNGCKICRLGQQWLVRVGVDSSSQERHLLHIDLIIGGWPAGPGTLLPPWKLSSVASRARRVQWAGRQVLVPAAEDMLLMLGAKISRHLASPLVVPAGGFIRKDFNDARFLLTAEHDNLDWDHILRSVALLNCRGVLHQLICDAEIQVGRRLAPEDCTARLAPGAIERRFLQVAASIMEENNRAQRTTHPFWHKLVLKLWPSFSLLQYLRAPVRGPGSVVAVVADRIAEVLFRVELRLKRSRRPYMRVMVPLLRTLRPGFGSLCELAPASNSAGQAACLSRAPRGGYPWALDSGAAQILTAFSSSIPTQVELAQIRERVGPHLDWKFVHHCDRLLFNVGPRSPVARGMPAGPNKSTDAARPGEAGLP